MPRRILLLTFILMSAKISFFHSFGCVVFGCCFAALSVHAQSTSCAAAAAHAPSPAEEAYAHGQYDAAESLYMQALLKDPQNTALAAAMVRTLLHEGKVSDAEALAKKALANDAKSAAALTAMAEVQYRKGQPWLAMETLEEAIKADGCYARAHLIRSRVLRIDSMYASERKELQAAYEIDPEDADIKREWLQIDSPAKDIEGTENALATMKDVDADLREKAMASVHALMGQLTENSQTCKSSPITASVSLPLVPMMPDARHVNGYQLEVQLPQGKTKLIVDTAASGLYISRTLADANGLQHREGDPVGTVRVESVRVGSLEFRDCMVGVSDVPFPDKESGFIGTDVFAPYLVTLDFPAGRLELAPLPAIAGEKDDAVPGDRPRMAELAGYSPVYHRQQFLLLPVMVNKKESRLFVLDTGMRMSTMTPVVAHAVSPTKVNFTNPMPIVGGGTVQIYRDNFELQFADLAVENQGHILDFDPAAIDESAGFEVAGLMGFDILHAMTIHMDYRDGLMKFDSAAANASAQGTMIASAKGAGGVTVPDVACDKFVNQAGDLPTNVTIEGQIVGWIDSAHVKVGQPVSLKMMHDWEGEGCELPKGAMLYGTVTASSGSRSGGELALMFDHGDCADQKRKALLLRVIGVVGPPGERKALHDAMPSEVSGGARDISQTVAGMDIEDDDNLNPGGPPKTVHPGIVVGLKGITMTPEAGPQCSALLSSVGHSVRLDTGSELILSMEKMQQP